MGLFSKKNIQTEINITAQEGCLIWQCDVEQEFSNVVRLNVGAGCQAAIYVNGVFQGIKDCGSHSLPWKDLTKKGGKITVIGINKDKQFKLLFGAGGVPFNDRQTRQSVLVGIHGECNCRVSDGHQIYLTYGQSRAMVTPEDVKEDLHAKLQERLIAELSRKLSEFDYFNVFTSVAEISDVVKEQYSDVLYKAGISLVSCSVSKPHFPEGYDESRKQLIDQSNSALFGSSPIDDREVIKEIFKNKGDAQANVKICSNCNKENDANAMFCKYCGKKIG